jgi:hypothetical protein
VTVKPFLLVEYLSLTDANLAQPRKSRGVVRGAEATLEELSGFTPLRLTQ